MNIEGSIDVLTDTESEAAQEHLTPESSLQKLSQRQEHALAQYASLLHRPVSNEAKSACLEFLEALLRGKQVRKPRNKQIEAFGGLIADLLMRNPDDAGGWLYRSLRPAGFSAESIGYRVFTPLFTALSKGWLDMELGKQHWTKTEFTRGEWQIAGQRATRFRANANLIQWFDNKGINFQNCSEHFATDSLAVAKSKRKTQVSLVLRGGKPPLYSRVTRRPPLSIDHSDPTVKEMVGRIEKLNAFLIKQKVAPYGPAVQLKRIFAEGQLANHGWRFGGRLYASGKDNYQTAKPEARNLITINGLKTVEIDLRSSHLTILVGLGHIPPECLDGDPYAIEGLPRSVVKQWVTMTISHGRRHTRWPPAAVSDFQSKHGIALRKDYPLKATGDKILSTLPLLSNDMTTSSVGWGELQFIESEVILSCMETLAFTYDTPSLPVHDNLIVPLEKKALALRELKEAFRQRLGIEPVVGE